MSFRDEMEQYRATDLELILNTQQAFYSEEEQCILRELLAQKKQHEEAERQAKLPPTIPCEKCGAPNDSHNENCAFCGSRLLKEKYYISDDTDSDDEQDESEEYGQNFTFHYVISFLIPLVGLMVGAIMLTKDDAEKIRCGKTCIITAIVSTILLGIILGAVVSSLF